MKKFLVIGNPIEHSLSPELHNYWIKKNNIDAIYEKQELREDQLEQYISKIKDKIIVIGCNPNASPKILGSITLPII